MDKRTRDILLVSTLFLTLYGPPAFSNQSAEQSQPPAVQFGVRQPTKPEPIPADARPPDSSLQGAPGSIAALAFSPDGKSLAWSGYRNTIVIWNAATGAEERRIAYPQPTNTPVTQVVFSPDGNRMATATNREVRVWDYQKAHCIYSVRLRSAWPLLTFSPDGKFWAAFAAGAGDNSILSIEIHDTATGDKLRTIPTKWYGDAGMTITRDGLLIASGATEKDTGDDEDQRGTVQIWNVASGEPVKTSSELTSVGQVSPDGRFMANPSSSEQGKPAIVITDLSTGLVKWTFPQDGVFVFSPDSKEIAVTNGSGCDQGFTIWSLITGAAITSVGGVRNPSEPGGPAIIAFSPDGNRLAAAPYPVSAAKIWDVTTGREIREFAGQFSVQSVAMSPDGKWLVTATPAVTVQDPATGKTIATLTTEEADLLVFSPDGRWFATNPGPLIGGQGKSLELWDTRTWAVLANITPARDPRQSAPVTWIGFGGAPSAQTKVGDAQSLQFTADGQTHTVWFSANPLAVSPDGKLLAELGHPTLDLVDIWDANSGQKVATFSAHKFLTQWLTFSRDGRLLLSAGWESERRLVNYYTFEGTTEYTVKVWDTGTWKERSSISFPKLFASSAVLSSDGRRLAIKTLLGAIEILDVDSGKVISTLAAAPPETFFPPFGKGNLAFNPDGTLLFQGAAKNGIYAWKLPRP